MPLSMLPSILSIAAGATLGALLRWLLAGRFNPMYPALPMGTLAANLAGGYLVGIAVAYFADRPDLSPEVRLFVITGFLGGLTTFSTFSAEVVMQIHEARLLAAFTTALVHMLGSFALTALGIATVHYLRHSP
jgi:fluoride exporter